MAVRVEPRSLLSRLVRTNVSYGLKCGHPGYQNCGHSREDGYKSNDVISLQYTCWTGSNLKVNHNQAEDRRLELQRWLLQTRYVWSNRFKFILVSTIPRWMRVYTVWVVDLFIFDCISDTYMNFMSAALRVASVILSIWSQILRSIAFI